MDLLGLQPFSFRPFHSVPRCSFPFCLFYCQQLPRVRGGGEGCAGLTSPSPHSASWHPSFSVPLTPCRQCLQVRS